MISSKVGHSLDPLILRIYKLLFKSRIVRPNVLTVIGLVFSFIAFVSIFRGYLIMAAIFLFVSGFFDVLDGAVARNTAMITVFGGFFDSVLDRYSDLLVMFGIFIRFLNLGDSTFAIITFFAAIGVAVIPYARARAEAASVQCKSGILERPERIILLVIGLAFDVVRPVVLILAVLTHFTVLQRILVTRKALQQ